MQRFQTSRRGGIQDFLCPFTDMYITQGSNNKPSHMGIMANDVRGIEKGKRYFIFAPCDIKCIKTYRESGQAMWQSLEKVRFANGRIDYATIMVAHDNTMDCYPNLVIKQGNSFFQMGDKGNATGVHTHIQISQSKDTSWYKNRYGVYQFNNEYDLDDCYFMDNTNILEGRGGNWKYTSDIKVCKLNYNMNVRVNPDLNAQIIKVLKKDSIVEFYTTETKNNSLWGKYSDGWICIKDDTTLYCNTL